MALFERRKFAFGICLEFVSNALRIFLIAILSCSTVAILVDWAADPWQGPAPVVFVIVAVKEVFDFHNDP